MKLQIMSDLHLEFEGKNFRRFINMLDPEGVDVLALAGDICSDEQIIDVLSAICHRYANADVIYVHGNHEFYLSNIETVRKHTSVAVRQNKNLHWLDCEKKVIRGKEFIGAPLWFQQATEHSPQLLTNDFRFIENFENWVYAENRRCVSAISDLLSKESIVITHYLPSNLSVAARYKDHELNRFFVCDIEHLMHSANAPRIWVHGHTHDTFDYKIQHMSQETSTRVVCNPRGYWPDDLNPDFRNNFIIEI
jgi:Icc-related predicted phosphoesterase